MNPITTSKDCLECKECCKFHDDEVWFAPVFTEKEIALIPEKFQKKAVFTSYRLSKNVKQIQLLPSKNAKALFVCPYYDEQSAKCEIYLFRPLDCKMWPVMFMRTRSNDRVHVVVVKKKHCRSVRNVSEKERRQHDKNIMAFFSTKQMKQYLRTHQDVIWPWESGYDRIGTIAL